ncbi:MAG TPA: anti-sigma factor [Mycobacterium sp.]|nr:anti-sigma factor [Mycobacterium sp.]
MTEPNDLDLIALATPYALHAVPEAELADIERRVAAAPPDVAAAFADEVRAVRETMAVVSATTAVEPPSQLRDRLLTEVSGDPVRVLSRRIKRWQTIGLAAAAAVIIGLGALGVGIALQPKPTPSTAEQVFAAPDVQTVSGEIPTGGTATVVFSRERNAGVLVMNNVAPPKPGTVYQMWLIDDKGPHSAGTMDAKTVAPSTTAVLPALGDSQTLAFTVEPPGGSTQPTSAPFAKLALT